MKLIDKIFTEGKLSEQIRAFERYISTADVIRPIELKHEFNRLIDIAEEVEKELGYE